MKVACTNPGCHKHTHSLFVKSGLPGTGKMKGGKWFCGHGCYTIYLADCLIADKRSGLCRTVRRVKPGSGRPLLPEKAVLATEGTEN
jgi:hypothetical protein